MRLSISALLKLETVVIILLRNPAFRLRTPPSRVRTILETRNNKIIDMALQFREKEKVNFCDIIVTSSSSFHYTQKLNFEIKNIFFNITCNLLKFI